jgi:2-polyprenyl-3-methyl-5-hydroxy-6-metoxy-1,4-benzoquinol methylase
MSSEKDKAGEEYWSGFWKNYQMPQAIDLSTKSLANYSFRQIHKFYSSVFSSIKNKQQQLIEIGCGNSTWLSYFHKNFGFEVSGIDYSEYGCEQTKKILARDGVPGNIYLGDLFNAPENLIGKFDVVCSFGVVEHFNDTRDVLEHIGKFLKPGGILITTIPNLTGITGTLQKWMNKPVYDIHKVMTLEDISGYVKEAGFEIIQKDLVIPMSFGVTLDEIDNKKVENLAFKKVVLKGFQVIEKIVCLIDDKLIPIPKTEYFCAGMLVAARKPE